MKPLFVVLATVVLLQPLALAADTAAPAPARSKPRLEKGMSAEEIRQLLGRPNDIAKVKSPDDNAERWTYRRKIGQTVEQTANTRTFVLAMTGVNGDLAPQIGPVPVPEYRLKYIAAYQVTALLIVDGKLEFGRQWYERDERFAD
jgi:hypothetical protein